MNTGHIANKTMILRILNDRMAAGVLGILVVGAFLIPPSSVTV